MRRTWIPLLLVAVAAAVLLPASAAGAHAYFPTAVVPASTTQTLRIQVPHELDDGIYNVEVAVQVPSGWTVQACTTKATWSCDVDGQVVTWNKANGSAPSEDESFAFTARSPSTIGTFSFPTIQIYSNGVESAWIGAPGTPEPAPTLRTVPPTSGPTTTASTTPPPTHTPTTRPHSTGPGDPGDPTGPTTTTRPTATTGPDGATTTTDDTDSTDPDSTTTTDPDDADDRDDEDADDRDDRDGTTSDDDASDEDGDGEQAAGPDDDGDGGGSAGPVLLIVGGLVVLGAGGGYLLWRRYQTPA